MCPRCGSDHIFMATMDGLSPIEDYKMWICQNCYLQFNERDDSDEEADSTL